MASWLQKQEEEHNKRELEKLEKKKKEICEKKKKDDDLQMLSVTTRRLSDIFVRYNKLGNERTITFEREIYPNPTVIYCYLHKKLSLSLDSGKVTIQIDYTYAGPRTIFTTSINELEKIPDDELEEILLWLIDQRNGDIDRVFNKYTVNFRETKEKENLYKAKLEKRKNLTILLWCLLYVGFGCIMGYIIGSIIGWIKTFGSSEQSTANIIGSVIGSMIGLIFGLIIGSAESNRKK